MIKKIASKDLKLGMFISDLNCGWLENPFMANSLMVKSYDHIEKLIQQNIHEVYIDTDKGRDTQEALPEKEADLETTKEIEKVVEEHPDGENRISMKEEMENAVKIRKEVSRIATEALNDIRHGKELKIEKVSTVVDDLVESIFNNKHALTSLSQIKDRDEYTFNHSVNVCILMATLARTMKIDKSTICEISTGALLHDIGKMMISDRILNKQGKLTEEEFYKMKTHVNHGCIILSGTKGITDTAVSVANEHHERFDGSGYPNKLKGDKISKFGRMASIADVYDAITSDRCYHKGMDPTSALKKIFEWSKYHFDKSLVETFIRSVGIYPVGTLVRLKTEHLAVITEPGAENMLEPQVRIIYNIKKERFINPRDVDLAKKSGGVDEGILCHENHLDWKINPLSYLAGLVPV